MYCHRRKTIGIIDSSKNSPRQHSKNTSRDKLRAFSLLFSIQTEKRIIIGLSKLERHRRHWRHDLTKMMARGEAFSLVDGGSHNEVGNIMNRVFSENGKRISRLVKIVAYFQHLKRKGFCSSQGIQVP